MGGKYSQGLGRQGEKVALQFLRRLGYKIIARNFSCRWGEIDIIAEYAGVLVFVEVKTRKTDAYGAPEEAVDWKKIRHLQRVAQFYLVHFAEAQRPSRFDVIAVTWNEIPRINHIQDAF